MDWAAVIQEENDAEIGRGKGFVYAGADRPTKPDWGGSPWGPPIQQRLHLQNLNVCHPLSWSEPFLQLAGRIFISEHQWKGGKPTEEEALMLLGRGDGSAIPVPAVFIVRQGLPCAAAFALHGLQSAKQDAQARGAGTA